ncbi:uncharacterized protein [Heterodontus francisci]|uniref:uncharacterized protein isoform X2 n=1 Tax=Heterodontus francisci TaxID=7792 RepID=UPI00355B772D
MMSQQFKCWRQQFLSTKRPSAGLYLSNSPAKMWQKIPLIVAVFVTTCASQNPDQCHSPPSVMAAELTNEYLTQQEFFVGQHVSYKCLSSYIWNDSTPDFIICQPNLSWSKPLISCIPKDCGDPMDMRDGYYRVTGRTVGHKATYYCNKGYQLFGKRDVLCTNNGWNKITANCAIISCDPPHAISNGDVIQRDEWTYGINANYLCHSGYTLIGQHTINCTETGDWSHHPPVCKALPDHEGQLSISATTISTIQETTRQTTYITTHAGGWNHLLSLLPGYTTAYDKRQTDLSPTTTVNKMINKRISPNNSPIPTDSFDKSLMHSASPNYTTAYDGRQTDLSPTTTVNKMINKRISPNNSPIPTDSFDESLMLSASPNYSSYEYWKKWIYFGVILIAIIIVLLIIKVICERRKYGSYTTGSQVPERQDDTELATMKLIRN